MVTILQRAYSATLASLKLSPISHLPSVQTLSQHQQPQQLQTPQSQPQQPKLTKTTTSSLIRSSCSRIRHCQRLLTMVLRPTSEKTSSTRCRLWNLRRCVTPLFFTVRAKVASADHSLVLTSTTPPTRYWFRTSPHPPPLASQQDYSRVQQAARVAAGRPSPDHSPCPSNPLCRQPLTSFTILSKKNFC